MSKINKQLLLSRKIARYIDQKLLVWDSPQYAYTIVDKSNILNTLIISTYPQGWVDIYREKNFQCVDPVIHSALTRFSPFSWGNKSTDFCDLNFIKKFTTSTTYPLAGGFTFVLHDHNNKMALLSMITSVSDPELEKSIITERNALQMLLIDIHEQMYKADHALYINDEKIFLPQKNILSVRENEVLYWSSRGKTYGEIAIIIGIILRTVKFHMGNVVRKLGAGNARQAIRTGVELKLIIPPF